MKSCKTVLNQTLIVLTGEVLLSAVMTGIFAILGHHDTAVLLGAAAGSLIATLNFFIMAMGVTLAAHRAQQQDIKGGQALVQLSYGFRLIGLFVILIVCARTEVFNLPALVIPLTFTGPILSILESFQKKGAHNP